MSILHELKRAVGLSKPKKRKKRKSPARKKNGEFKKR